MLFTKSTAYTLQALIELSKYEHPIDVNTLSEKTDIPRPFLAKLLQNLSRKNIIKSYKGIHGGFKLIKSPEEIKIIDLFKAIEDKNSLVFYCSSNSENCTRNRSEICSTIPFFTQLEKEIEEVLLKYTLADVIRIKNWLIKSNQHFDILVKLLI